MSCAYHNLVQSYHDRELSTEDSQRVEAHLRDGCASCSAELAALQAISQKLAASMPIVEASADARMRLHQAVDQQIEKFGDISLVPLARGLMAVAASLWFAATVGLLYVPNLPPRVSEPQPWEGAIIANSSQAPSEAAAQTAGMEPELPDLIVADLSRRAKP